MEQVPLRERTDSPLTSRFTGRRVHFIGIGGCGMSGLARMLLDRGAIVTGSEPSPNEQTFELNRLGASISRDQMGELLSAQTDLVVRTAAVPDDNAEYLAACALGKKPIKYAELLGEVMAERFGVAVAGTHGKSTTTAMIGHVLLACGADPSFVIGATVPQLGGGSRSGTGDVFVAEACEYDRSFHHLRPRVALMTNIEADHLDCYLNIDEIVEAFRGFADLVPADGIVIANRQDRFVRLALNGAESAIQWVEISETASRERPETRGVVWSVRPAGIHQGCRQGELYRGDEAIGLLRLSVPGEHNLFNASMAVAACAACGIDPREAVAAVSGFAGVHRRMTELGRCKGAIVIDDYAHHPTEIRATLTAIRERYRPRRLFCVFQPHQHSRTWLLLDAFARSFEQADQTILPTIYSVRDKEEDRRRISSADLAERIVRNGQQAWHLPTFDAIVMALREEARHGDLIVTMGAGNVWEIARELVKE